MLPIAPKAIGAYEKALELEPANADVLSDLASALTGYAAHYGLLTEEARKPNLEVTVTADLQEPTDFSILGDWIGKQRQRGWDMPYGPIPLISGLPESSTTSLVTPSLTS